MYSREQLTRIFMNWPSYADSTNLADVEIRADVITAVSRFEEVEQKEAEHIMNTAWQKAASYGSLDFIRTGIAFADLIRENINAGI